MCVQGSNNDVKGEHLVLSWVSDAFKECVFVPMVIMVLARR